MKKAVGLMLLMIAVSVAGFAAPVDAPEIDPNTGMSALALLSGAILMLRGRKK